MTVRESYSLTFASHQVQLAGFEKTIFSIDSEVPVAWYRRADGE